MAQETIKFIISQDGTVTEEVIGVTGTQCLDVTEKLEEKLGVVQWRKETQEYYQKQTTEDHVTLHMHQEKN